MAVAVYLHWVSPTAVLVLRWRSAVGLWWPHASWCWAKSLALMYIVSKSSWGGGRPRAVAAAHQLCGFRRHGVASGRFRPGDRSGYVGCPFRQRLGIIALGAAEGAARLALEWRRCEPLASPGPSVLTIAAQHLGGCPNRGVLCARDGGWLTKCRVCRTLFP